MTADPASRAKFRRVAILLALLLPLVLIELAARVLVGLRWTDERVADLTQTRSVVGRFASHPYLPYALAPDRKSPETDHNSLGLRGPEIALPKPSGTLRIAGIGGSTTYGLDVRAEEAWPELLAARLRKSGRACDAINAGVPGWVSTESLVNLALRVLPLDPDVVVIYEGRNEVFPESYNRFQPDYSHFRRADYSMETANYGHRRLFRWCYSAMVLCTWHGERFGWSGRDENPVYGCTRIENRPTVEELTANLADPRCRETFRRNLVTMAGLCKANGIRCVLSTVAVRPEKLATDHLRADPRFREPFGRAMEVNNAIVRDVAREQGTLLVEGASVASDPSVFSDDCHMTAEGYARLAALIGEALEAAGITPR